IPYLSNKTGINPETVHRHVDLVCSHLGRPTPAKITRAMLDRGREELLAIPGIGEATLQKLYLAGIYNAETLRKADPERVSPITGIAEARLHDFIGHLE
ncbi:MAG: helix-hairpin-helix domain-containing protein, partial [Methanoculleus sp.]